MLLWLSYHGHVGMTPRSATVRWCKCVVSHGYGGLWGVGMEVVDGMHAGWSQALFWHVGNCRSISQVQGEYTDDTQSHCLLGAQIWEESIRNWLVFLGRFNAGRHEKTPVRCPCSRLAALHGAPRRLLVLIIEAGSLVGAPLGCQSQALSRFLSSVAVARFYALWLSPRFQGI